MANWMPCETCWISIQQVGALRTSKMSDGMRAIARRRKENLTYSSQAVINWID